MQALGLNLATPAQIICSLSRRGCPAPTLLLARWEVLSGLSAGNYRLVVKPWNERTGAYQLSFQAKTP